MEASYTRTVTAEDIILFADVTGDRNPVHLDAASAAGTPFGPSSRTACSRPAYISTVFGMELPRPGGNLRLADAVKQVMPGSGLPGPLMFLLGAVAVAVARLLRLHLPRQSGRSGRRDAFRQVTTGSRRRACTSAGRLRSRRCDLPKVTRQNIIEIGMQLGRDGRAATRRQCARCPRKA